MENITTFNLELLSKFDKIFVLVSGGIDSTYLYQIIKQKYPSKVYPVNCFNPYEFSTTLDLISKEENFISIKPHKTINYKQILISAFLNLPKSRIMKKYSKKVFGCCRQIKHNAFNKEKMFKEENTVVIDGIKYSDGMQRRLWLKSLYDGKERSRGAIIINAPTFFHKMKNGMLKCYPFRDYKENRNLPENIIDELKMIYPNLTHSGCKICPVLVRFEKKIRKNNDKFDLERLEISIEFAKRLNVY